MSRGLRLTAEQAMALPHARIASAGAPSTPPRCSVTGNPCGTDTWAVGHDCQCAPCQRWLANHLPAEAVIPYAQGTLPDPRRMNRTEAAYARELDLRKRTSDVVWYDFECITLRLADDTRYTPDFLVLRESGGLEIHETKGFMRDDARVKLRVAARLFSFFRFYLIRKLPKKSGGGWQIQEVPHG